MPSSLVHICVTRLVINTATRYTVCEGRPPYLIRRPSCVRRNRFLPAQKWRNCPHLHFLHEVRHLFGKLITFFRYSLKLCTLNTHYGARVNAYSTPLSSHIIQQRTYRQHILFAIAWVSAKCIQQKQDWWPRQVNCRVSLLPNSTPCVRHPGSLLAPWGTAGTPTWRSPLIDASFIRRNYSVLAPQQVAKEWYLIEIRLC